MSDRPEYDAAVEAVKAEIARQAEAAGDPEAELERDEARQQFEAKLDRPMTRREVMAFTKRLLDGGLSDEEEADHYERMDSDGAYINQVEDAAVDLPAGFDDGFSSEELSWAAETLENSESTDEERAEAEALLLSENLDDVPEVEMAADMTRAEYAAMLEGAVRRGNVRESEYGPPDDPLADEKAALAVRREQRLQAAIHKVRATAPEDGGLDDNVVGDLEDDVGVLGGITDESFSGGLD